MSYNPDLLNGLPILKKKSLATDNSKDEEVKDDNSKDEKSEDAKSEDESWSLFLYLLNKDRSESKVGIFCLVETSNNRKKLLDLAGIILVEGIAPVVRIQKHRVWRWLDVNMKGDDEEHIDLTLDFFTSDEIENYKQQHLNSTINLLKEIRGNKIC
jgi:hypothetical protein